MTRLTSDVKRSLSMMFAINVHVPSKCLPFAACWAKDGSEKQPFGHKWIGKGRRKPGRSADQVGNQVTGGRDCAKSHRRRYQ